MVIEKFSMVKFYVLVKAVRHEYISHSRVNYWPGRKYIEDKIVIIHEEVEVKLATSGTAKNEA